MLTAILLALLLATVLEAPVYARPIREALRHADISITKAALWMEMDRALLDRRLNGEGHLRHADLCKLPLVFWQWYGLEILLLVGIPKETRRVLAIELALMARRRQMRMTPKAEAESRTA